MASCLPLITIGCNSIHDGDSNGFCMVCPFVAICGKITPGNSCTCCPYYGSGGEESSCHHPNPSNEARCVCGICLSCPICMICCFPCCILSYCLPEGYVKAQCGKGYDEDHWED